MKQNWNRLNYRMIVAPEPESMLSETNQNESQTKPMLNETILYNSLSSACIWFASILVNLFAASFRMDTTNTTKFRLATSNNANKKKRKHIQCLLYRTEYKVIYFVYFLSIWYSEEHFEVVEIGSLLLLVFNMRFCATSHTKAIRIFFLLKMSKAQ